MQINFTINIDDRLVAKLRNFFTKRNNIAYIFIGIIATTALVYGASVTKPWEFNNGDLIDADKINDNFDMLYQKVNELDAELTGSSFGIPQEIYEDTLYLAETDGFVYGVAIKSNNQSTQQNDYIFQCKINSVSFNPVINPVTDITFGNTQTIPANSVIQQPFLIPINKGKYWSIIIGGNQKAYWLPVGH